MAGPPINQPIGKLPYFYDGQMTRILNQFMRIFTVFQYQTGLDASGNPQLVQIPVIYGEADRQATQMLQNNSENTTLSVPRIAVTITDLTPAALTRGGYQGHVQDLTVQDRKFDQNAGTYTPNIGNNYHVQMLRPNPIDISFRVDIWTSNTDQKFQIFEQIYTLFNPSLDLQTTSSNLDWTGLNLITMTGITWDYNGPDLGTDTTNDVMAIMFTANCWINPPARVTRQVLIHSVIERLGDRIEDCDNRAVFEDGKSEYEIVTPGNAQISVNGDQITLLGANGATVNDQNQPYSWPQLLDEYGGLNPGESKLSLRWIHDIDDGSKDIIGTITLHPTLDNILLFDIITDTLPIATLVAVDQVIDPHALTPGNGLPAAGIGQRYLLSAEIGSGTDAWGNIIYNSLPATANVGDIIQYDGTNWVIETQAATDTNKEFVYDTHTGILLRLENHVWVDFVNQMYHAGYWNLML